MPHSAAGMRNEPRVRAAAQWHHVHRQRCGGTPGRAARVQLGIERVAGCAPHHVAGVGACAQLRDVGLADHDRPGAAQTRHQQVVLTRNIVAKQLRAVGGEDACGFFQVLDPDRQTMQQTQRLALHHGLFGLHRFLPRPLEAGCGEGVDLWV